MKTQAQIAKDCGVERNTISAIVKSEKMTLENKLVNKFQEDLIHQILYFSGKITEITLHSKINENNTY